jgi:hypothetical protein
MRIGSLLVAVGFVIESASFGTFSAQASPRPVQESVSRPPSVSRDAAVSAFNANGPSTHPLSGWPQSIGSGIATPVFFDLDGDGKLEVIVCDGGGSAWVFGADGSVWPGWPRYIGGGWAQAAVGDVGGDGSIDIVFATTWSPTPPYPPELWVLDPHGNNRPGFPVPLPRAQSGNVSGAVLADLDGNGRLDVGAASELGVSFFDAAGTRLPGWPYLWPVQINNRQNSSPAVGDIDRDGKLEVVVGTAAYPDYAVHVIRADGTPMPGWPQPTGPIYSSPALADLDGDGRLEIIAQEGEYYALGNLLHVWRSDGTELPGWPLAIAPDGQSSSSSPAIADLDDDGVPEIVAVDGVGGIHAFHANGNELPGFPFSIGAIGIYSSPAVVDVDGDGSKEIFLTFNASPGQQLVGGWKLDGTQLPGFPRILVSGSDMAAQASVHVADADGDGQYDIAAVGNTSFSTNVWVLPISGSIRTPSTSDWPKIRNDAGNRGCYGCAVTSVNHSPVAKAGADHSSECSGDLKATVVLDGSASADPDSTPEADDLVAYEWFEDFDSPAPALIGTGKMLAIPLALGRHVLTLRVTDRGNLSDTNDVVVIVADTLPPTITVTLDPHVLRPPDHRLVDVAARVTATDVCGGTHVVPATITSSEPDDAPGRHDGATSNDIQRDEVGTPDLAFLLRAERSARGAGRVYTVSYKATDAAGNEAIGTDLVLVPHDGGVRPGAPAGARPTMTRDTGGAIFRPQP